MDVDINDLERVIRCNNGKSSLLAIIDFVRFTMDGTKQFLGIGDDKETNQYNPFGWFNDATPKTTV